jgi:fanconi-associated nuclease 1
METPFSDTHKHFILRMRGGTAAVVSDDECIITKVVSKKRPLSAIEHADPNIKTESSNLTYVEQMDLALVSVLQEEFHLFPESELNFLQSYRKLNNDSKMLHFSTLNNRTYKWERIENLYPKVANMTELYITLLNSLDHQMPVFEFGGPESLEESLALLRRHELESLCDRHRVPHSSKQMPDLIKDLIKTTKNQPVLSFFQEKKSSIENLANEVSQYTGHMVKLTQRVRFLFHCVFVAYLRSSRWPMEDSFMTESILSNVLDSNPTKMYHAPFKITRFGLFWVTRDDFLEYMRYIKLEYDLEVSAENNATSWANIIDLTDPVYEKWKGMLGENNRHVTGVQWLQMYKPGWILTRIMSARYMCFFRLKKHEEAITLLEDLLGQNIYGPARRGGWHDELVRLVEKYRGKAEAVIKCKEALADTMVLTAHRSSIQKRLFKLCKGKSLPACLVDYKPDFYIQSTTITATKRISKNNSRVYYETPKGPMTPEEFALEHFKGHGYKGYFSENSIITTLFGLLFWDIIFDDTVPGVFSSPFQRQPLDMKTVFFYASREDKIERRLKEIEDGNAMGIIFDVCHRESPRGTRCVGI